MLSAIVFAVTFGAAKLAAAPLPFGTSTYQISPPLGAATPAMPMIWNIPIQDPANTAKVPGGADSGLQHPGVQPGDGNRRGRRQRARRMR